MKILLVEDDALLGEAVQYGLKFEGNQVDWIKDGQSAVAALETVEYDCVVLDLGLPRKGGLEVLRDYRRNGKDTPVLILTAMDSILDRVAGLDSGADDYLVKPFDMEELSARLRALNRRRAGRGDPLIRYDRITIYPHSKQVYLDGNEVNLTRREYAILHHFLTHTGRVFTRNELESFLYSWDGDVESNTIQVHIHHLRKKLYRNVIRNVRGIGYVADKIA